MEGEIHNSTESEEAKVSDNRSLYLQLVSQVGVPCSLLALVLWGIYAVGRWAGGQIGEFKKEIVFPVVTKHIEFLESTTKNVDALRSMTEKISGALEQHEQTILKNQEAILINQGLIREGNKSTGKVIELLESIDKKAGLIEAKK